MGAAGEPGTSVRAWLLGWTELAETFHACATSFIQLLLGEGLRIGQVGAAQSGAAQVGAAQVGVAQGGAAQGDSG